LVKVGVFWTRKEESESKIHEKPVLLKRVLHNSRLIYGRLKKKRE